MRQIDDTAVNCMGKALSELFALVIDTSSSLEISDDSSYSRSTKDKVTYPYSLLVKSTEITGNRGHMRSLNG